MRRIQLGCGEWGFRDLPMRRHFEIAREFGFRVLEFGIGGGRAGRLSEHPTDAEIASYLDLKSEFQIATPHCCIENDFTLANAIAHDVMLAKVLAQMRVASRCGATHVRLFTGFTLAAAMTEPLWRQLLDALQTCALLAEELKLVIALETHGAIEHGPGGAARHTHTITTTREGVQRLLCEMPATVGFNFDPGNIKAAEPTDRRLLLDLLNARINYCHLKDWRVNGAGWDACAIGDDDLDYRVIFEQIAYDGVYLIEYEPTRDVENGIQRSLDYLRSLGLELAF